MKTRAELIIKKLKEEGEVPSGSTNDLGKLPDGELDKSDKSKADDVIDMYTKSEASKIFKFDQALTDEGILELQGKIDALLSDGEVCKVESEGITCSGPETACEKVRSVLDAMSINYTEEDSGEQEIDFVAPQVGGESSEANEEDDDDDIPDGKSEDQIQKWLIDLLNGDSDVEDVVTFRQEGRLSREKGVVVTLGDGTEFDLVISKN